MTVAMLLENTLRCAALTLRVDLEDDSVPATTHGCPLIPIRHLQATLLRDFLRDTLNASPEGLTTAEIYQRVLSSFGAENCKPYVNCPHYATTHPEYKHVTRLALWDAQRRGAVIRTGKGQWKLA